MLPPLKILDPLGFLQRNFKSKSVVSLAILPIENGFDTEIVIFFIDKDIIGQAFKEQKKEKVQQLKF
ncbi:MAG: hypothetical protein MTP17_00475 [Candidatus Midichloria sp.]|nr:MAG: hypothetical protein MTP17_00475 [Candidatus Midichloria sp.]